MKRKLASLLIFALLLGAILTGSAFAATAAPTSSTIQIDGKTVSFDAYLIGGNNYIKLRDLGYSLTGTNAQFDIGWNGQSIILSSDKAYTPVGGEMSGKGTKAQNATPANFAVIKDGVDIPMSAYNINGNNYFKLRDVAQIFDFSVDWVSGKVTIDTRKPYTMPAGSALAVNSYPLLLIGMTKAQIDEKLGTPTVGELSDVNYPGGLTLGFNVVQGDVPTDSDRCFYVSGRVEHIVSGCPASLNLSQMRSLFGSGDVEYSEYDDGYVLSINYGNVPLVIDCDSKGSVKPGYGFYYNVYDVYTEPAADYSWAETNWYFNNCVKYDPSDEYPYGESVLLTIKEASADKLRLDAELTSWYGTSWVSASVMDEVLYSSDGKTYMAFGVTDTWDNTLDITVQLSENKLILKSVVTKNGNMARFGFEGNYTLG